MGYVTVPEAVQIAAERFGERVALVEKGRALTFDELRGEVAVRAGALRVRPGDRVLIVAPNSIDMVLAWLAVIHAGAIPAAVNPELTAAELEYLERDLEAAMVLTDVGELEGPPRQSHQIDPLATAAIVYTSGTTSRPKGVQVRHAAYTETGLSFPGWIGLGPDERL